MTADDDVPALEDIDTGTILLDGGTLTLIGDVDYALVHAWQRTDRPLHTVRTVEAEHVPFMGSAGIGLLIRVAKAAPRTVRVVRPSRPALRPLQAMGVDRMFELTT